MRNMYQPENEYIYVNFLQKMMKGWSVIHPVFFSF